MPMVCEAYIFGLVKFLMSISDFGSI
jgi:hypothetical protein